MADTLTNNSESISHAGAALLEAGCGCATAPLCQRRSGHTDSLAEHTQLGPHINASFGAPRSFSSPNKDAGVINGVNARLRNATKLWLAIAGLILLFFLIPGAVWRAMDGVLFSGMPAPSNQTQEQILQPTRGGTAAHRQPLDDYTLRDDYPPRQDHWHEPLFGADDHEQTDEESEYKQHPDDPSFIDAWDGEDIQHLNLSRGIEGLKTPLYRLPFAEGQHNETHAIGLHGHPLAVPRYLLVSGGQHLDDAIGGSYSLLMTSDGRPKPLLVHGRPIWKRIRSGLQVDETSFPYLFYDHGHHTWVFNKILEFQYPHPLAFLPHGALLPVFKALDRTRRAIGDMQTSKSRGKLMRYVRHGVPASVHWIVRGTHSGASLTADETIRVTGDPAHSDPLDFYTLSLQKVFHVPEYADLDGDEMDEADEEEAEEPHLGDVEENDEDNSSWEQFTEERQETMNILSLPASTRTRQHFLTHPLTLVYHTFEQIHSSYPHASILQDPVEFLEKNAHPDVETVERRFGDDSTAVPHPLRSA